MALKQYKPKTVKVFDESGDEVGDVRGLSLNDIVALISINRPAVEALFNQFNGKSEISDDEVAAMGMEMLAKAPHLVAQVIALASEAYEGADEGDVLDGIMQWPTGLQMAFLEAIGPLTFAAGGGVKKLLALALKAAQGGSQSAK